MLDTRTSIFEKMMNERIMIKCSGSIEFVEVRKILYVASSRAYCKLYLIEDAPMILSCPLKTFAEKLSSYPFFFRSHKSHLINMAYVKSLHSQNGIKLIDGTYVPLTQNLKKDFIEKMEESFGGNT